VVSGQATDFQSLETLLAFMAQVLRAECEHSAEPSWPRREGKTCTRGHPSASGTRWASASVRWRCSVMSSMGPKGSRREPLVEPRMGPKHHMWCHQGCPPVLDPSTGPLRRVGFSLVGLRRRWRRALRRTDAGL
jgi:hypothetical protein